MDFCKKPLRVDMLPLFFPVPGVDAGDIGAAPFREVDEPHEHRIGPITGPAGTLEALADGTGLFGTSVAFSK